MNGNGVVTVGEVSTIKARYGDSADEIDVNYLTKAVYDINCSGLITTADYSVAKTTYGHTAPACP